MTGASTIPAGAVRGLACPSCGAAIVLRGLAWTQTVACASCGAVLDARDPNLAVLQRAERAMTVKPLIPLGARGLWHGAPYEAIGFQQRTITVDGTAYSWREYLLFNPYRGFRYLTEYDGHWSDVVPLAALPTMSTRAGRPTATYAGEEFRHFQSARAKTTFVAGEFPWEVRRGDVTGARDYVSPPRMLSEETTPEETTWSLGEYVAPDVVWKAFKLPGSPPTPRGVYANQPSPYAARGAGIWRLFGLFVAALVALFFVRILTARDERVFEGRYLQDPRRQGEAAFVTPSFEVRGHTSNLEVKIDTDAKNTWLYLDLALIDEGTGRAFDFGREVSYYEGYDSDGRWTEGSRHERATLGSIPPGRYFLRVEPQSPTEGDPIGYTIELRRDVALPSHFALALLLLAIPPALAGLGAASFEQRRWAESDYAPASSDDDDE